MNEPNEGNAQIVALLKEIRDGQQRHFQFMREQAEAAAREAARSAENVARSIANQERSIATQQATARLYRHVVMTAGILAVVVAVLIVAVKLLQI